MTPRSCPHAVDNGGITAGGAVFLARSGWKSDSRVSSAPALILIAVMQCLRHYCNVLSLVNLQVGDRLPERLRRCDNAWMTGLSLALANLKPGTGKTTSAVWLAHVFAQAGNSVLLVDADPSGSALEWSDLAAMYPGLPPLAAFPFRIVALPSRELHRRIPEIALTDDVVIIDAPQLEDHAGIARSAMRY